MWGALSEGSAECMAAGRLEKRTRGEDHSALSSLVLSLFMSLLCGQECCGHILKLHTQQGPLQLRMSRKGKLVRKKGVPGVFSVCAFSLPPTHPPASPSIEATIPPGTWKELVLSDRGDHGQERHGGKTIAFYQSLFPLCLFQVLTSHRKYTAVGERKDRLSGSRTRRGKRRL